jgi:hypothetical protein
MMHDKETLKRKLINKRHKSAQTKNKWYLMFNYGDRLKS